MSWKSIKDKGCLCIFFSTVVGFLFPQSISLENYIKIHEPATISIDRSHPSFSAFKDTYLVTSERAYSEGERQVHLVSGGRKFSPQFISKNKVRKLDVLSLSPEKISLTVFEEGVSKKIVLQEEGIARPTRSLAQVSQLISMNLSEEKIEVSFLKKESFDSEQNWNLKKKFLTDDLKKRWRLADEFDWDDAEEQQPSLQEVLRQEVAQVLEAENHRDNETWIKNSQGQNVVYVRKNSSLPNPLNKNPSKRSLSNSRSSGGQELPVRTVANNDQEPSGDHFPFQAGVYSLISSSVDSAVDSGTEIISVEGHLSVLQGLALSDQFSLFVYHTLDGEILQEGRIWLGEGRFQIPLKTSEGYIEAVLVNKEDAIIGYQRVSLLEQGLRKKIERAISSKITKVSLNLELNPVRARGEQKILSKYFRRKRDNENWRSDSFFLFGLSDGEVEGFRSKDILSWQSLNKDFQIPQGLSAEVVESLKNWVPELSEQGEIPVLWGQVLDKAGNPLPNAKVTVNSSSVRVYYFNGFFPDKSLKKTSSSGYFMVVPRSQEEPLVVDLPEGLVGLRVTHNGEQWPTEMAPVRRGKVSRIQLKESGYRNVRLLFEGDMGRQEPQVFFSSVDLPISVSEKKILHVPITSGPTYVETSETVDLVSTVSTLKPRSESVRIPRVSKKWLKDIKKGLGIEALPETGVVFGWGDTSSFEVSLEEKMDETFVAYFSADGEFSPGAGVAGGFFLIFNVPQGLNNVFVRSDRGIYTEAVFAELHNISVMDSSPETAFQ